MIGILIFAAVLLGGSLAAVIAFKIFKRVVRLENEKYGKPYIVGYSLIGEKLGEQQYMKFGGVVLRAANPDDAREKAVARLFKRAYLKSQIVIDRVTEQDGDRVERYWSLGSEVRALDLGE